MQWFFAFSGNASTWFNEMIRVAVISAKEHTTLEPHCLYDGERSDLTDWLSAEGVNVHFTSVPFRDELFSEAVIERNKGSAYSPSNACGHFLRVLTADFADGDNILYTDCDVMFEADPILPETLTVAGCPELSRKDWRPDRSSFNSGVMSINVAFFRSIKDQFIEFCRENGFYSPPHNSYDQVLLNRYFAGRWQELPAELNWRPVQGWNQAAQIIHFHGPKPHRLKAIMDGKQLSGETDLKQIVDFAPEAYDMYIRKFYQTFAKISPIK